MSKNNREIPARELNTRIRARGMGFLIVGLIFLTFTGLVMDTPVNRYVEFGLAIAGSICAIVGARAIIYPDKMKGLEEILR